MASQTSKLTPCHAAWLLSREIRHLQHRLERLEHGMEHIYAIENNRMNTSVITAFQELDMLAQSTEALAIYVERLSVHLGKDRQLDLAADLAAIPLRDLAMRLGGLRQEVLVPNSPELF